MLSSAEVYDPVTGIFTATGPLNSPRAGHTSTRLSNGQVLIAGGEENGPILATAELYDPSTRMFTLTGSMATTRSQHAAALLSTGQVLILGGEDTTHAALASAELYDPASGNWTSAGFMTTARRHFPQATPLLDNRVLITGGELFNNGPILHSAELYDPGTGAFTATDTMAVPRTLQTATRLQDGRVLISGGFEGTASGWVAHASAELYDPPIEAFLPVGSLQIGRGGHGAVLLSDGRVLVAGGADTPAGASDPFTPFASAEIFDPSLGSFAATSSMIDARLGFDLVLLHEGFALAAGGHGTIAPLDAAEILNPALGRGLRRL